MNLWELLQTKRERKKRLPSTTSTIRIGKDKVPMNVLVQYFKLALDDGLYTPDDIEKHRLSEDDLLKVIVLYYNHHASLGAHGLNPIILSRPESPLYKASEFIRERFSIIVTSPEELEEATRNRGYSPS